VFHGSDWTTALALFLLPLLLLTAAAASSNNNNSGSSGRAVSTQSESTWRGGQSVRPYGESAAAPSPGPDVRLAPGFYGFGTKNDGQYFEKMVKILKKKSVKILRKKWKTF